MVPIRVGSAAPAAAGKAASRGLDRYLPECVVLCGGLGTRLAGIAGPLPKAMVSVAGRPFLEWLIAGLRAEGVTRLVLATGYRAEPIRAHFGDGAGVGVQIRYSHETAPLGTGGALRQALAAVNGEHLLVVNGDTYTRIPVADMLAMQLRNSAQATLLAVRAPERGRYGGLEVSDDGRVIAFREKSTAGGEGWISAGAYLIARSAVEKIPPDRPVSLETELLPSLVGRGLFAVASGAPFIDIGTPESYRQAASIVSNGAAS